MIQFRLIPKTRKGEQRIKLYGGVGRFLRMTTDLVCQPGDSGPWLLIEAADPTSRWIRFKDDPDFDLQMLA